MSAKECGCGLQLGFQGDQTRNLYRQIVESLPCFACFENLSRIILDYTKRSERIAYMQSVKVSRLAFLVQVAVEGLR